MAAVHGRLRLQDDAVGAGVLRHGACHCRSRAGDPVVAGPPRLADEFLLRGSGVLGTVTGIMGRIARDASP